MKFYSFLLFFINAITCLGQCVSGFDKTLKAGYLPGNVITTNNNQFIVTSTFRDASGLPERDKGAIIRFTNDGTVLNTKNISFTGLNNSISDNVKLNDGNFLLVNHLTSTNADAGMVLLHKFNEQLNGIWTKSYNLPFKFSRSFDLAETSDGNIYLYFQFSSTSTTSADHCAVAKFDASGNFIWCTTYQASSVNITNSGKLVESGDYLYFSYIASEGATTFLTKIEKNAGEIVWSKSYNLPGRHVNMARQMDIVGDNIVLAGSYNANYIIPGLLMINKDGFVKQSVTLNGLYTINGIRGNRDGLIFSGKYFFGAGYINFYNYYLTTDTDLNFKYGLGNIYHGFAKSVDFTNTGSIIETGFASTDALYLKKHPPQRKMGVCDSLPVGFSRINEPVIAAGIAVTRGSVQLTPASPVFSITDGEIIPTFTKCSFSSNCTTLKVSGNNKVCNTSDTYTYKAIKNPGCTLPVEWVYDHNSAQQVVSTDSTVSLKFLSGGSFKIKARLLTGCESAVEDSIEIKFSSAISGVNLGGDKIICKDSIVRLSAGSHFQSYKWQDGSTDSIITVTRAGKYYVVVTDACGIQFSDTINITIDNITGFDIDSDITKCNNDTVSVLAPAGYANYSWTPVYNTMNHNTQILSAYPSVTNRYYVTAINRNRCPVSDSVLITVKQSQPILLPNDTSICSGQSIVLNAGASFKTYLWSTSESTQNIQVKTPGTYSVSATDINNCKSSDTFKLLNVYPLPVVHLGNDTAICKGSSFSVNAGSFSSYRWQDNSSANTYKLWQPGKYYVNVTDVNGCTNSDTINITGYKNLPVDFLPAKIEFCQDEPVDLKTNNSYFSYRWNTGSTASFIKVAIPGMYFVEVTNTEGCKNSDTTYASYKDCYKLVYFPTAFSPNYDGKNDVFKPKAYGTLLKFRLTIFNKYGHIVFNSTDPSKGWDGTIKGVLQNSQTFIWISSYLFSGPGEKEKLEKGTIVLLR